MKNYQTESAHRCVIPLLILALAIMLALTSSHPASQQLPAAATTGPAVQIIPPVPDLTALLPQAGAMPLVYHEPEQPTDLLWFPDWAIAGAEPIAHATTLSLYRGPAHANLDQLTLVDFIEPDLPVMPERYLYALEPLPADQRYYLAYTTDWATASVQPTAPTHLQYSTELCPGELGGFSLSTLQNPQLQTTTSPETPSVAQRPHFYHGQLYFVSDDHALQLQATADGQQLTTQAADGTAWFAFQVTAPTTTPATPDTLVKTPDYSLALPALTLNVATIGNPAAACDLYRVDLTSYLYPETSYQASNVADPPVATTVQPLIPIRNR